MMMTKASNKVHKTTLRLPSELMAQVDYWRDRQSMSLNEYIIEAIEHKIRYENKDYNIPDLEVQRLNQMFEVVLNMTERLETLEAIVTHGFNSIIELTRGTNYLLDDLGDDDGK